MKKISIIVLIIFIFNNAAYGAGIESDFRSLKFLTSEVGRLALRPPLSSKGEGFIERAGKAEKAVGNKQIRRSIIITSVGTFVAVTVASLGLLDIKISYPRISADSLSKIVQMDATPKIPSTPIAEYRLSLIRKEFESSIAAFGHNDISTDECIAYAHRLKNAAYRLLKMTEEEDNVAVVSFYNYDTIAFLVSFINKPEVVRQPSFIARETVAVAKQYILLSIREMVRKGSIIDVNKEDKIRDILKSLLSYKEKVSQSDPSFPAYFPFNEEELLTHMIRNIVSDALAVYVRVSEIRKAQFEVDGNKSLAEYYAQRVYGLPSVENFFVHDPIVDVYRHMLYDGPHPYLFSIGAHFETKDRIERAKNEPVHNIPLSLIKPVQEIRRWRNLYGFVQESAKAYQIPADVIFATIAGDEYQPPYTVKYAFSTIIPNRRPKWAERSRFTSKFVPENLILPYYWNDYLGGVVMETKNTMGLFQLRPATIRRYQLWKRFGIDAQPLSDGAISWMLIDPRYNIEAGTALLNALAQQVEDVRTGRTTLQELRASFKSEVQGGDLPYYLDYPALYANAPSLKSLGLEGWRLSRLHPIYGTKIDVQQNVRWAVVISGVTDERPARFTEINSIEAVNVVESYLTDRDAFFADASRRTLRELAGNSNRPDLQKRAREILKYYGIRGYIIPAQSL